MINFRTVAVALAAGLLLTPAVVAAQVPGFDTAAALTQEFVADHYRFTGDVVLSQATMKFYADTVDYYPNTNRLVAEGNVLVQEVDHQIAADRADFDAKTRLGTFYNARGFAALGTKADVSQFGTLQPDVQFYGETIEKTGPDSYVISRGGFTTCAQATPRWEMTAGSIKLRLDHYAFLRSMFLKAKGIPVLFLPVMYYPISSDNRQTGFLMPSYGSSTYRGQTISNGFFWAMNRSQDATFLHDWYSKTGQAVSGEYRYVSQRGSGNMNTTFNDEHPTTWVTDGVTSSIPGSKSFRLTGALTQGFGPSWYGQGRANYFSNITVQQRSSVDINQTALRNRFLGGSVSGALRGYRITGTYDRSEFFNGTTSSSLRGSAPRINLARPDRAIGQRIPVYVSVTNEYVNLVLQDRDLTKNTVTKRDIHRLDTQPVVRYPFNRLSFLTLNTSLMWRNTFWSDSQLPNRTRVDAPISRRFLEMSANLTGPSFVRIFDAPNSSYAQRFKHTIEPFLQITRRTAIDNANQILNNEYVDGIVGKMTQYAYGASTRLYGKRTVDGPQAVAREIVAATLRQTYSTDANAILNDQNYRNTNRLAPSHFSPVQLTVRATPTNQVNATFRTEFDGRWGKFQTFGADGSWNSSQVSLLAGWSQVHFRADAAGKNIPTALSHYLNSNATVRFKQNRFGVVHSFNWDIQKQTILQQRIAGYYNAQCCGFTAEFQTFDFTRLGANAPVPKDSRFHFSVTLAGIGNVSNIFGALSGTPNR